MKDTIIALVAVGDKSVQSVIEYYVKLKKMGFEVKILTDQPHHFNEKDVRLYTKKIFNYFDKIFFCLNLVSEFDKNVLYFDDDYRLSESDIISYIENSTNYPFTYLSNWPDGKFYNYKERKCFRYLLEYLEYKKIPLDNFETIWENVSFYNRKVNHKLIEKELEIIKPVFDFTSLMNDETYTKPFVISGAEGLALSIVMSVNNIPFKKISL